MSELIERLRKMAINLTASQISSAMFEAADALEAKDKLIAELVEALKFYSGVYEPGLSRPNEGPWGVNSKDFGEVARSALEKVGQ